MSRNFSDASYLPDTVLGTRDTTVNKVAKYHFSWRNACFF